MTQGDVNEQEWNDPNNWHGGVLGLYYSRLDDRAFVPKRRAWMGVTVNFATGTGIGFMIGVVVFITVIAWASVR